MADNACIFCRLAAGAIPSARIYEDAACLAFLDIAPLSKGHTLVIPRAHHNPLMATPDDVLARLIAVVRRVAQAQVQGLGAVAVNVTQANGAEAGQVVPHLHFHVIPRYTGDRPLHGWTPLAYASADEADDYARRIREAIAP